MKRKAFAILVAVVGSTAALVPAAQAESVTVGAGDGLQVHIEVPEVAGGATAKPCTPKPADIGIGAIKSDAYAYIPGSNIYYFWESATSVTMSGACHTATINRTTYTDQPIYGGTGTRLDYTAPDKRVDGTGSASHTPRWSDVLYYGVSPTYTRTIAGTITVRVEAWYVEKGTNLVKPAGCAVQTWSFTATPDGPWIDRDLGKQACPGSA